MQQEIPSYEAIVDTLDWAAQGFVIDHGDAIRPMLWRQTLDHLAILRRDELLCIDSSANGMGSDIAVRPVPANGGSGATPSATNGASKTTWTVDTREGSRAKARLAQRIEVAVRSGECRSVTCTRRGSRLFAVMTGVSAPAGGSNGNRLPPLRVGAGASA